MEQYVPLLKYFNKLITPTSNETRTRGEVFTPMNIIHKMLDDLPKEVWKDPSLKWFDPANGIGNFPVCIFLRLMKTLENYKDKNLDLINIENRRKHILEKMIYVSELGKTNCLLYNMLMSHGGKYKLNIHNGDSLDLKKINNKFGFNYFNIIIGNPPYNTAFSDTSGGASALYHKFIETYMDHCTYQSFIVPSRWFSGGKGMGKFRKMMLNRTDIVYIKHFDDASKIFGNSVDIKGGVNYYLKSKNYNGMCKYNNFDIELNKYDILVEAKFYKIVDKILSKQKLTELYVSSSYSGINTNDKRLVDTKINDDYLKCYVSKQKGFIKYININDIPQKIRTKRDFNKWKVFTVRAAHKGNSGFGNIFIGKPMEISSQSYILFEVHNEEEAKSLESFLKSRLANFILSVRKITQDISEKTCKWIPLPPLNIIWDDEKLYKHYKLSKIDIELINKTNIIGFKS